MKWWLWLCQEQQFSEHLPAGIVLRLIDHLAETGLIFRWLGLSLRRLLVNLAFITRLVHRSASLRKYSLTIPLQSPCVYIMSFIRMQIERFVLVLLFQCNKLCPLLLHFTMQCTHILTYKYYSNFIHSDILV